MGTEWAWLQPSWSQLDSWQQRQQQQQAEADSASWHSSGACSCSSHSSACSCDDGEWLSGAPPLVDTWPEQVEVVPTRFGALRVTISGDRRKHPLLTYHDIALDHTSCFGPLFQCPDTAPLLRQHFCVFHVDAPGHELGAPTVKQQRRRLTVDDLAEQVADVIAHYGLAQVTCLGVTAGAYVLTLLATKRPALVRSLILVSPVCRTPTWSEWAFNKVLLSLLSLYGLSAVVAGAFSGRYLAPTTQCKAFTSHVLPAQSLSPRAAGEEREPHTVAQFADAFNNRGDITEQVERLQCPCLVMVGEHSAFRDDALHLHSHLPPHLAAWFQVPASGSLVTVECPHRLRSPLEKFLRSSRYPCLACSPQRPSPIAPSSPLAPSPALPPHWSSSLPPRSTTQYRPHSSIPLSLQQYITSHAYSSSSSSPSPGNSPHASTTSSSSAYSSASNSSCLCLTPPSASSSPCHSPQYSFRPEDLSLEAIGCKLKPIRTKIQPGMTLSMGRVVAGTQGKLSWC